MLTRTCHNQSLTQRSIGEKSSIEQGNIINECLNIEVIPRKKEIDNIGWPNIGLPKADKALPG